MSTVASEQGQKWFILRGEMQYGPYEYRSLITMIQKGELQDYNYCWAPHLDRWTLVGDLPEFSKDSLLNVIENKGHTVGYKDRKHNRVEVNKAIPIFAHNDHRFFDGYTISISENGALILMNDPLLLPTQKLLIQFRECDLNPQAFNVEAEIVRKNYTKQRLNVKSGLHYAVRFTQVQEHGVVQLKNWTRPTTEERSA